MRGYNRRCRDLWSAVRWHAFQVMAAMPYSNLGKAGIHKPSDLIQFPWDVESDADIPSDEEIEEMRRILQGENEKRQKALPK